MVNKDYLLRDVSDALCNHLAKLYHLSQYRNTRYHRFREIHISDLASCPIKSLLSRVFEVTPPCRLLYYMREGLEWETKAIESLKEIFPTGEAWKHIEKEVTILGIDWKVIGTPDLYDYNNKTIVEIKWTRFSKHAIMEIMRNKEYIMSWAFPGFKYWEYPRAYKVWDSWFIQVMGYLWLIEKSLGRRFEAYLYVNRDHDIDLLKVHRTQENEMWEFLEQQLNRMASLLKYYIPKIYPPQHSIEKIVWRELREVYCMIWKDPKLYSMVEYQCRLCPFAWINTCPGVIPVRKFSSKKFGRLWDYEEVEHLRMIMGFSDSLQRYIQRLDPELYEMLINAKREDYPKILTYLMYNHNESYFIGTMIRMVKQDCQYAFRIRPPRTKTIKLD